MTGNEKRKPVTTRPGAPPKPLEVDRAGPEPMAVALDKQTTSTGARPTTAADEDEMGGRSIGPRRADVSEELESDEDAS